jgi:DUF4097 and DUF4098 domain-containing protein YvlB
MAGSIRLRGLQAGALIGALTAGPACVIIGADQPRYVEREEKRFAVSGKPDVSLSTFDGAIEVRTSEGLRILGIGWNHASAKLIVTLPAASNVEAHSGDGSIDIERVTGTLNLRSGDGSIHGRQLTGDVKVHTGDGAIKLDEVTGALDADTGDGSINVTGRMTSLRVRTGDGSVTIRAAAGSTAEADWNITTGDGSVVLEMPEGFGGELDAHTGDGRIHMQDLTLSNVIGPIGKTTLRGRLGAGGHAVRVRTGDGSITLRRLAAERG